MVQTVDRVGAKPNDGCHIALVRHDWTRVEAEALYNEPFSDT